MAVWVVTESGGMVNLERVDEVFVNPTTNDVTIARGDRTDVVRVFDNAGDAHRWMVEELTPAIHAAGGFVVSE